MYICMYVCMYVCILLIYDWNRSFDDKEGDYWQVKKEIYVFQSLFFHWCQTCSLLVRQLLIWFKYYHLVDWWRIFEWWRRFEEFDQKDVTKVPSGKIELWLYNGIQELAKTMIT